MFEKKQWQRALHLIMQILHRLALFAVVLALAGAPVAGGTNPQAGRTLAASKSGAKRSGLSDAELEKAIRARFARSKISTNRFEVHVQGGVATLEGRTDVVQHKGTATRLAKLAGAAGVVNRIQVSQAAREKAAANLEKGRRRAQLKRGEERSAPRAQARGND
jgi:osmotically-inducible protein OsmY